MASEKPTLLMITDLRGKTSSDWWEFYVEKLSSHFEVYCHDSCALAGIDHTNNATMRHRQFVNGGIKRAAKALQQRHAKTAVILGFSIGGTIAWQAALNGFDTAHLWAISATRLRKYLQKPMTRIHLIYGETDPYRPSKSWHQALDIEQQLINDVDHELYHSPKIARVLCQKILDFQKM